jgi:parallel beta-helix repeat protein
VNRAASIFILLIILSLALALASETVNAPPSGIIRIRSDGAVEGTDKIQRNGDVYTIIDDISGSAGNGDCLIAVEKDSIVLDGAGHIIQGTGTGIAIEMKGRNNVTIKNVVISNFGDGIDITYAYDVENGLLINSSYNRVFDNTITTTYWGISLKFADHTIVSGNTINSLISKYGIMVEKSYYNTFVGNKLIGGSLYMPSSTQSVFQNNKVKDKPLVVLEDASNQLVDGAGQVLLFNCNNMTIKNVDPSADLRVTIQLQGTNNTEIKNCKGRIALVNSHNNTISKNQLADIKSLALSDIGALALYSCNDNRITENVITAIDSYGIYLEYCANNSIYGNSISSTSDAGIELLGSTGNNIHRNYVANSECGIELSYVQFTSNPTLPGNCVNNSIYDNNIAGCEQGISFKSAHGNSVFRNNITDSSKQGVRLFCSDNNAFYHNNFINNSQHANEQHAFWWGTGYEYYYSVNNTWDNGYPSGGNFWSDYNGTDANGDGIGDIPYTVYENMTDHYPLMEPFVITESLNDDSATPTESPPPTQPEPFPTTYVIAASASVAAVGVGILVYFKKRSH